jgi:hypothetical protein
VNEGVSYSQEGGMGSRILSSSCVRRVNMSACIDREGATGTNVGISQHILVR